MVHFSQFTPASRVQQWAFNELMVGRYNFNHHIFFIVNLVLTLVLAKIMVGVVDGTLNLDLYEVTLNNRELLCLVL